jgi:hypothetical protein
MSSIRSEKYAAHTVQEKDFGSNEVSRSASTDYAVEQAEDYGRTLWQNAKLYRKIVYVTLGLSSAILLYGYDNVIVGTVSGMPSFQ